MSPFFFEHLAHGFVRDALYGRPLSAAPITASAVELVSDARSMTGELVKVLREGLPGDLPQLTFNNICHHIHYVIHSQSRGRQSPVYGYLEGRSKGQMVLTTPVVLDPLPENIRLGLLSKDPKTLRQTMEQAMRFLDEQVTVERQRLESELRLAGQIQQTFLPDKVLELPGWDLKAYWQAA